MTEEARDTVRGQPREDRVRSRQGFGFPSKCEGKPFLLTAQDQGDFSGIKDQELYEAGRTNHENLRILRILPKNTLILKEKKKKTELHFEDISYTVTEKPKGCSESKTMQLRQTFHHTRARAGTTAGAQAGEAHFGIKGNAFILLARDPASSPPTKKETLKKQNKTFTVLSLLPQTDTQIKYSLLHAGRCLKIV